MKKSESMVKRTSQKNNHQPKKEYTYELIKSVLSDYQEDSCYSFSKKENKADFDKIAALLPKNFVQKEEVQSVDLVYSGGTNTCRSHELYITLITGRIDKNMYDFDVFNVTPLTITGNTYLVSQSFHFKDESGRRLTVSLSDEVLPNIDERKTKLYNCYLTGSTTTYNVEEYEQKYQRFLRAHHQSFREIREKESRGKRGEQERPDTT